jgi:hypothetical protein
MWLVTTAVRTELLEFHAVWVVAPVLLGDVVAVLALGAGQRDLRTYVGGCHGADLSAGSGLRLKPMTWVTANGGRTIQNSPTAG